MAFYVVTHKVNNFDDWKKVYDEFDSTRERHGVNEHYAMQSVEDPNLVLVLGEGKLEAIQKYLNSDELRGGMESAGIAGPPEVFVGENRK